MSAKRRRTGTPGRSSKKKRVTTSDLIDSVRKAQREAIKQRLAVKCQSLSDKETTTTSSSNDPPSEESAVVDEPAPVVDEPAPVVDEPAPVEKPAAVENPAAVVPTANEKVVATAPADKSTTGGPSNKRTQRLAAVGGHHPPAQPYLKLPDLASIGRATPSKSYKDGDIVHTSNTYEDEASTDDRFNYTQLISKGIGFYLLALLSCVIIPNYVLYYSAGANMKGCLSSVCEGNEILFAIDCNGGYFCADPEDLSIDVSQQNKFYLEGTGQEHKETRDYVIGRVETFVKAKNGKNFIKQSEDAEHVLWTPLVWLYNRILMQPTQARPHLHGVTLKDSDVSLDKSETSKSVANTEL